MDKKTTIPPWMREATLRRDGYRCVAPQLDGRAGWCRDSWGNPITHWSGRDPGPAYLQMDHVKDADKPAMGKKAPTDEEHLVSLCPFHHTGTAAGRQWATSNRERLRRYLEDIYRPARKA